MQHSIAKLSGAVGLPFLFAILAATAQSAVQATEGSAALADAPEGLMASEWASILQAYEAGRHGVSPVADGFHARNPGQQWGTTFDGRGFTTHPDAGAWTWGLELVRYGFSGQERSVDGLARVQAEGQRVSYEWNEELQEWFVNDGNGLEHGYTVHQRPAQGTDSVGTEPLMLAIAVRGELTPRVTGGGRDVDFLDESGATVLTYAGLKVFDANGETLHARFEALDGSLLLSVDERDACYPLTIDPTAQQAYLKASSTDAEDAFGHSVAISGDTVVIGAPLEDSNATGIDGDDSDNSAVDSGAAYVFLRVAGVWSQQAYLKASNTEAGDGFGFSVSISGDTIVVGAAGEDSDASGVGGDELSNAAADSGAAYVFVRNVGVWSQEAYLKASNTDTLDSFGQSVAVDVDTLVVGAFGEDSDATGVDGDESINTLGEAGAAYVFTRNLGLWSQQAYLKASNTEMTDQFGWAVDVSGDTAVVSALLEDSSATGAGGDEGDNSAGNSGAAYVFLRTAGVWAQEAYLKASNSGLLDHFGHSVSIDVDTLVVGAVQEKSGATGVNGDETDNGTNFAGAAYVFARSAGVWSQEAYLKSPNTAIFDLFGNSVAASGDRVLIGVPGGSSGIGDGAAVLFSRSGTTWSTDAVPGASNAGGLFGWSVGMSGDTAVAGATGEDSSATGVNGDQTDTGASNSGAAYVYDLSVPYTTYCTQAKETSVAGCVPVLTVSDLTLATGTWDSTNIPRSGDLADGNTLGIYIYTNEVAVGQSRFGAPLPFGTLCISMFKRSAPACMNLAVPTIAGLCNPGVMSLSPDCNSGALGILVGDDVNVQLWYRDPTVTNFGNANFSNAIYYTVQ